MRLKKNWIKAGIAFIAVGMLLLPASKQHKMCLPLAEVQAADDNIVAEGECGEKLTYKVQRITNSSWELVIEGVGEMNDYTEAVKAPWYYYNGSITKITTPVGLDSIGDYAFYDMQKVTEITLTRGINRIGEYAFYRCSKWDPGSASFLPDYLNTIEDGAFEGCSKIEKINIPIGVASIGKRAFAWMNGLTTVYFPTGKKEIELGNELFAGSRMLTSVTLPDNLTTITGGMFNSCTALETITLPQSVTEINGGVFYDCQSLKEITIPEGVEKIESATFERNIHLKKVTLPSTLKWIGYDAFCECLYLSEIKIPDSVERIDEAAFFGCIALTEIKMPENLRAVKDSCFNGCRNLVDVQLNETLSSIGQYAFDGTALTQISIPVSVRLIGQRAFGYSGIDTVEGFIVYGHSDVVKEYAEKCGLEYQMNHDLVTDESGLETVVKGAVAATTTKKGYTGDSYCKHCDQLLQKGSETAMLATKPAGDTSEGNLTDKPTSNSTNNSINDVTNNDSNHSTNSESSSTESSVTDNVSGKDCVDAVKSLKAVAGKKSLKLSWKKVTGAEGYEIQYSLKSNYKNARKIIVKNNKKTIKNLKVKKKYYIRVHAYKNATDATGKVVKTYSKWTKISKKTK